MMQNQQPAPSWKGLAAVALMPPLIIAVIGLVLIMYLDYNNLLRHSSLSIRVGQNSPVNASDIGELSNYLKNVSTSKIKSVCSETFFKSIENYSTFHAQSLKTLRESPESAEAEELKFIVWKCANAEEDACAGLADRLQGIMSTFMIAMATRRIMMIHWTEAHDVFDDVAFNWTYDPNILTNRSIGGVGGCEMGYVCCDDPSRQCMNPDPSELKADVIIVASGKNMAGNFFQNPSYQWWGQTLSNLGLSRQYSFGCSMRHIFNPDSAIIAKYYHLAHQLLNPAVMSFAIHVRMGDKELFGLSRADHNRKYLHEVLHHFEVVKQLGCDTLNATQHVLVLFVSDSVWLRHEGSVLINMHYKWYHGIFVKRAF